MSENELIAVFLVIVPVGLVVLRLAASRPARPTEFEQAPMNSAVPATGSSTAERQVASGRKNVQVLNGLITVFNVISAIGLAATIGFGVFMASESGNAGEEILFTILGAIGFALVWLISWALISLSKNILGAVTESLALNVERADGSREEVKAAA